MIGLIAFMIPVVCVTLGLVAGLAGTMRKMNKQLAEIEDTLKKLKE